MPLRGIKLRGSEGLLTGFKIPKTAPVTNFTMWVYTKPTDLRPREDWGGYYS
jgi:hypothetical protein